MGLGYCPGNVCVVSTFWLSNRNKSIQLFKVAIHELDHTQGLEHCEVKTCFMWDAEGKNPTNEKTEFCKECRQILEAKGWASISSNQFIIPELPNVPAGKLMNEVDQTYSK